MTGDYHSLSLTCIQFHPPKITPLTNLVEVQFRASATETQCCGWHDKGIYDNRYAQREFIFKFSVLLKAYDINRLKTVKNYF